MAESVLTIDVLTLFPEMVEAPLKESMLGRARQNGLISIKAHNIRDWTVDKHRRTDDYLCGGGQGMLMKPEPIFAAVEELRREGTRVVLMTPQGKVFKQSIAEELAVEGGHLIIICGHYEGVDHRIIEQLVDVELSIGDYILTNGAIAAVIIIDAIARLIPGVLGDERSPEEESFANGLLEAPAYTKPNVFRDMSVPDILLGGNHPAIAKWKNEQALERTRINRPDLYQEWQKKNQVGT
ncbi:MAG: tRNA (guanosine(37)-N1)-methyltransferase TrmD [Akkermansia sp.]